MQLRLIGKQDLDCRSWILIKDTISFCCLLDGKTMRYEARGSHLAYHLPGNSKASFFCPSTLKFRGEGADLAADEMDPAAVKLSAQV
jgi:hypothetical protein